MVKKENYVKIKDLDKTLFNKSITNHLRDQPNMRQGTAVILDAETTLTRKALIKSGYEKRKINIVLRKSILIIFI